MAGSSLNTSQVSVGNFQSSIEEDANCFCVSYTHEDLKDFLSGCSLKDVFPFAHEIVLAQPLLTRFTRELSCDLPLNVNQLCDLYMLAIIMMTYQEENTLIMLERLKLVEVIGNLTDHLDLEDISFIAYSLYEKFVNGVDRIEKVIALLASIPAVIRASDLAADIAVSLLLIILAKYTKAPGRLEIGNNQVENAFNMLKLINWQHIFNSDHEMEMFVIIKSFGLVMNCRRMRKVCPDRVSAEIREHFMQICKSLDISTPCGMMVERYIAYCVIRGVSIK